MKKARSEETEAGGKTEAGVLHFLGGVFKVLLALFLVFAFLVAAVLYPFAQWDRARIAGEQHFSYLTDFNEDLNELEFLSRQYSSAPLRETALERKLSAAANYSSKARQAVTSWSYFQSFIRQNEGSLRKWSVDTAAALTKVEGGRSVVRSTASRMASELEPLVAKQSPEAAARYASVISELRELTK